MVFGSIALPVSLGVQLVPRVTPVEIEYIRLGVREKYCMDILEVTYSLPAFLRHG